MTDLPARANAKLLELRAAEEVAQDHVGVTARRIAELGAKLAVVDEATAAAYETERGRLIGRLDDLRAKHHALANLNARLNDWCARNRHRTFEKAKRPRGIQPENGESLKAAVERIRSEIAKLNDERRQVQFAGPTPAEAKEKAAAFVDTLAKQGRPRLTATHDAFTLEFDTGSYSGKPKVDAIIAWLEPQVLLRRLHAEIDAMPQAALTMTAKAKADRLATIKDRIFQLELQEEYLIESAEIDGVTPIARRVDASPMAILGLRFATATQVESNKPKTKSTTKAA